MSTWFSPDEMKLVAPAEIAACRSPIPTQVVSNGEFTPIAQTDDQRHVER